MIRYPIGEFVVNWKHQF